jgi:hypothetical protein
LKDLPNDTDRELTVLGKILGKDPNPKTAMVMVLDTMFAAIDTVRFVERNYRMPLRCEDVMVHSIRVWL